uniref:Uncharacterized protein n=1 Tax=Oryza punctata TaxID=4537 RepID=A0A0E0L1W0_ORYPU
MAPMNKGKRPVVGSSLAAMATAGNQRNPFALGGSAEYPTDDRERDLLLVKFLQSTDAAIAFYLQVNDGLSWIADFVSLDSGRSLQWLMSALEIQCVRG